MATMTAVKNKAATEEEKTPEAAAAAAKARAGAEAGVAALKQKEGQKGGRTTLQSPATGTARGSLERLSGR